MSSPVRKLVRLQRLSFYHAFTLLLHSFCRLLNSDWSIQTSVAPVVCKAVPGPTVMRFLFASQWWSLWELKIWFKRLKRSLIFSLHWYFHCTDSLVAFQDGRRQEANPPQVSACVWWSFGSLRVCKKGTRIRTAVITSLINCLAQDLVLFTSMRQYSSFWTGILTVCYILSELLKWACFLVPLC